MAKGFTIDRERLERYRRAADAARGESSRASDRLRDARLDVRDVQNEIDQLERSHRGDQYLPPTRARLEAAQQEVARLAHAQSEGAAARQHATALFARLEEYAKGAEQ